MLRNAYISIDVNHLLYTCRIIVLVHVILKCVESKKDDKEQCFNKRYLGNILFLISLIIFPRKIHVKTHGLQSCTPSGNLHLKNVHFNLSRKQSPVGTYFPCFYKSL